MGWVRVTPSPACHSFHALSQLMQDFTFIRTPSCSRLEVCSNTAVVTAINVTSTQWPVIWSIDGLPHDSFGLIPIPPPLGGVLILSPNVIMYTNGSSSKIAFRLNLFAPSGGDFSFPIINASATPPMISLDACHHSFLTLNRLLVSLNNGDLYIFHLEDDGRAVTNINISKAGTSAIASCVRATHHSCLSTLICKEASSSSLV